MTSLHNGSTDHNKPTTLLEQLLEEINFQRTKEMRQLLKDDLGFALLQGTTYWTDLFVRHFLFPEEHMIDSDDLLFFVRKKHAKLTSRILPKFQTEVDVFRKDSKKIPIGDPEIDWEETVYLNMIVHQFNYTLTLAICTRTSPKELQVLRRHSQKVYASPSHRRMDAKGDLEEMTYPHICFMVDNFDEVFCDILVRDGEMVCVELVASDTEGIIQGVIFLGSIRYDALKKVYDARSSLGTKMAQRMTFGLFSGTSQRVEFVRMKGPQGKGYAEMAVTKPTGSGVETPTSEPGCCATDRLHDSDWDDAEELLIYRHQRRLSDPSGNLNNYARSGWRTKPESNEIKTRSENEGLDSIANVFNEIEAGDVRDGCKNYESMDQKQVHDQHRQAIKVGSEILSIQSLPDDIMQQKYNAAVLLHDKEAFTLCENNKPSSSQHHFSHLQSTRWIKRRYIRARSVVSKQSNRKFLMNFDDNSQENVLSFEKNANIHSNHNNLNDQIARIQCSERSSTLPKRQRRKGYSRCVTENLLPPHRVTPDGTAIYYWCEFPRCPGSQELDDGAYNPLWSMRGFTQTFHFWKETKRAQSIPLNAFLTYITLPWWSIAKDILDHREGPILTF